MSPDFEFLKNIIELIPAVVSLLGLIGAGTIRRVGGKLVTNDPWAVFIHQLKRQTKIPTRDLVRIAMDLYSPLMRQEALARKLRQIELNNLSITREMLYQEVAQGGYHWVQHVLPPPYFARIIPQPLRLLSPEVKLELPESSPRKYEEVLGEHQEETALQPTVEGLSSIGEPLQEPSPIPMY
jgi:hypothetical protein